jgi:hypothetical protein
MDAPSLTLHKQFHLYQSVEEMDKLQWFALEADYGAESTYGSIHRVYKMKKEPKLLNIGDANIRIMIENRVRETEPYNVPFLHPNDQYAGGQSNKKYHNIVKPFFDQEYDGTIINAKELIGNDIYSEEDLDGATEVVLWHKHQEFLEEQPNNEYLAPTNIIENIRKRKKEE